MASNINDNNNYINSKYTRPTCYYQLYLPSQSPFYSRTRLEPPTYPFFNLQSILDVPHTFSFIFVYFYMYLFPISICAISNPCFYKLAPFGKLYLTDFPFTSSCHTILPNYIKLIPNISLSPVHNKENSNISTQRNEIHQHLNNRQPLQEITQIITNKPNNESNTTEEIQNTAAPNEIIFLDDILLITDIHQINT